MITGYCCTKTKVLVTCMLLIGTMIFLSQKGLQRNTIMIKVKENNLKRNITNEENKDIKQITVKSKMLHRSNSTKRLYHNLTNDIFSVQMKPDLMKLINPTTPKFAVTVNGSYLLENEHRCSSVLNLTILMMVLSSPESYQRRSAIRETWANDSFYSSYGTVRVLFLLGIVNDKEVQRGILKEFKKHGDILQGSFLDSYHNLSHKSVMGYKWATDRCRNAKYVIKTDDDLVINMFRILQNDIHLLSVNQYHVHCLCQLNAPIIRNKHSKYYVDFSQFKGVKRYPPYCIGGYVMILNDIVPNLYDAARQTPLFWVDDVFMYGLVMNNIPNLKYKAIKRNAFGKYSNTTTVHYCKREEPKCLYLYHGTRDRDQIILVWTAIMKHYI